MPGPTMPKTYLDWERVFDRMTRLRELNNEWFAYWNRNRSTRATRKNGYGFGTGWPDQIGGGGMLFNVYMAGGPEGGPPRWPTVPKKEPDATPRLGFRRSPTMRTNCCCSTFQAVYWALCPSDDVPGPGNVARLAGGNLLPMRIEQRFMVSKEARKGGPQGIVECNLGTYVTDPKEMRRGDLAQAFWFGPSSESGHSFFIANVAKDGKDTWFQLLSAQDSTPEGAMPGGVGIPMGAGLDSHGQPTPYRDHLEAPDGHYWKYGKWYRIGRGRQYCDIPEIYVARFHRERSCFPIGFADGVPWVKADQTETYFRRNEQGDGGWYPIGANRTWHSGVHLTPEPDWKHVRAIHDGEVVLARLAAPGGDPAAPEWGSRNFVMLKHKVKLGDQEKTFYSTYVHLRGAVLSGSDPSVREIAWLKPLADLPDDDAALDPAKRYVKVTHGGDHVRGLACRETASSRAKLIAVIPQGTVVNVIERPERGAWAKVSCDDPEIAEGWIYYQSSVTSTHHETPILEATEWRISSDWDVDRKSDAEMLTLWPRAAASGDPVAQVPVGGLLELLVDPSSGGFAKVKVVPDGPEGFARIGGHVAPVDPRVLKVKRDLKDAAVAKVEGVRVLAGDVIGHAGRFGPAGGRDVLHVEVVAAENLVDGQPGWVSVSPDENDDAVIDDAKVAGSDQDIWRQIDRGTVGAGDGAAARADGIICRSELRAFYQDPALAEKMRRLVCKHISEWGADVSWDSLTSLDRYRGARDEPPAETVRKIEPFKWLSSDLASHAGLPYPPKLFTFHPIAFVAWLDSKLRIDASPATAPATAEG